MRQIRGYTAYAITGMMLAVAALFLGLFPGGTEPQVALVRDVPGVNTPLVTVRLVGTRTTRTDIALPVAQSPIVPLQGVETAAANKVAFYFPSPDAPVIEAPPAINLVVPPDVAYHLEPLNQQPVPVTMVY